MARKTKTPTLTLGNIYCINWLDHFDASRVPPDTDLLASPVTVNSIGRLTHIFPTHICLEYSKNLDSSPILTSVHGIITNCITQIIDLGPGA